MKRPGGIASSNTLDQSITVIKSFFSALLVVLFAALPVTAQAQYQSNDIVDIAVANGSFTTLVAAVQAAGLVDTLKGDGPFTVFAPTDEAFAKLPAGTVESLLLPENKDQLVSILTYHVVAGRVPASEVVTLSNAATVNGSTVDIADSNGVVTVNNATVTATDIEASNGLVHVVDTVLLPPSN